MTDKIIIDGVDVSGCKLYDKTTHQLDFNKCGHVCKETECKYKRLWYKRQFQAEKEKVKELKEELQTDKDNQAYAIELEKDIEKYEQALEEIKEIALGTLDCSEWIGQGDNKIEAILQKCEVLEDE